MTDLFFRSDRYREVSPKAYYEDQLEKLIIQNAHVIRPDSYIVPFKKTVRDDNTSARADLAVIAKDYHDWMVVEVELLAHSLASHVIPQVRTLKEGRYTEEHATYLAAKNPELDLAQLTDMMLGDPPDVLVIYNKYDESWETELMRVGVKTLLFEIFRSDTSGRHIFAVDGHLPIGASTFVTKLTRNRFLSSLLQVASPAKLPVANGEPLALLIDDQVTQWERTDIADACYLRPVERMPLDSLDSHVMVATPGGQFAVKKMEDIDEA